MRAHSIPLIFKIAYPYHSLWDNCFLYFIFQKEVTLSGVISMNEGSGERQSYTTCWPRQGFLRVCPLTWGQGALIPFWVWCVILCSASSMCIWHHDSPTAMFVPGRKGRGSFASQEGCLQTYVCCETRCTGHGRPALTVEDDLVLSLPCASEVLFCPGPMRVSSFLATLIPADHAVAWHPGTTASGNGRLSAVRLSPWRE